MKDLLALLLAGSSSVIGVMVGRWIRPWSPIALKSVIAVAVVAGLLSEGASLIAVGPPSIAFEPTLAGFVLGGLAAFFSGRKPPGSGPKSRDG